MISEQYPDNDNASARTFWEGGGTTEYDPLLTRVVYPAEINKDYLGRSGMGYVLWDLEKHVKLVEIMMSNFSVTPKWVSDGSRFVINDVSGNGEFYAVTRDGVVTQLSHLNSGLAAESARGRSYFSDRYNWSPDGRHLAFWRESLQNSLIQGTLAILDTETGEIIDTCIPMGHSDNFGVYFPPIWSLDGKSLVTGANLQEDGNYQTVLIDLEGKFAAKLGENLFPIGWLADGDN